MKKAIFGWISKALAITVVAGSFGLSFTPAFALSLSSMSDIMSSEKQSTASNHEIKFLTPTGGGIAAGETVVLTFSGFDATSVNNIDDTDIDIATGSTNVCTTATYTEINVGATNGASQWGVSAGSSAITLTAPSSGTPLAADKCLRIKIGTNATYQVSGAEQITNGSESTAHTIDISGTFGDTGTIAVDVLTDDQVVITATLGPSISFAISDNTIGFGALSISATRYADGSGAGSGSNVTAHNLTAATNATGGYVITVYGPTLTSGGNNIDAIGGTNTAASPGTEQFGVRYGSSGGSGTVSAPYAASGFAYDGVSAPDEIASASGPSDTTTYDAHYIANIAVGTSAGSYSTTLTYTATATF